MMEREVGDASLPHSDLCTILGVLEPSLREHIALKFVRWGSLKALLLYTLYFHV